MIMYTAILFGMNSFTFIYKLAVKGEDGKVLIDLNYLALIPVFGRVMGWW